MADKITYFPPVNSVAMRPYNPTESNNYLNAHLDNKAYNQSKIPKEIEFAISETNNQDKKTAKRR